ncbi:serine protease HTRA3 [Sorghum bicolor]|nr:serine protease HTRA3 [Sorghum bicolor]|eukprot:XP_002459160.2 serine protease HTRA3 [Sorghum bicolor]
MTKRGADDLTRSGENKRACCSGEAATESSTLGDLQLDSNECSIWSETIQEVAYNLSRTVVSVVLSNGHTVLFTCSGIAIESGESVSLGPCTTFLTSACLVRALDDNKTKYHDDELKIEVRYGGNVYTGSLQQYDFDHDIAVVNVMMCIHVNAIYFAEVECPPYSKVVAVGRDISGKLMATSGVLTGDSSGSEDCEDIMISTCKISEAWRGGPFVDFDGNFVGMNICLVTEGTLFLPEELILERLVYFRTSLRRTKFIARLSNAVRNGGRPIGDISNSDPEVHRVIPEDEIIVDIDSLGYPKLSKSILHDGMVLVNTFEEPFGDVYCEGVWSELSKKVSDTIC